MGVNAVLQINYVMLGTWASLAQGGGEMRGDVWRNKKGVEQEEEEQWNIEIFYLFRKKRQKMAMMVIIRNETCVFI